MPTGVSIPPPTPWRMRNSTSWPMLWARPHSTDALVKMTMAVSRIRLVPKRSPSQPDAGMVTARLTRKATTTASTPAGRTWNCRPSVGRATFTMVMSMMAMNIADTKTTLTLILGFKRRRAISRQTLLAASAIPQPVCVDPGQRRRGLGGKFGWWDGERHRATGKESWSRLRASSSGP